MENETAEKIVEAETTPQPEEINFPVINGDGHAQFDPKTGFFWVGINLSKFPEKTALAFFTSQEFHIRQLYDKMQADAIARAQLVKPGVKANGGFLPKFMRR